jgi:hypothetical protein
MDIIDKIDMVLNDNKNEDQMKVGQLLDRLGMKHKKDMKKIHKDILDNVVNSKYGRTSNSFVDAVWVEFNKRYPS